MDEFPALHKACVSRDLSLGNPVWRRKKTQSGSDNQCCLNNCKKWIDGTTQWAKKCVRLTLSIFFLTLETGKLEHSLILASANFLIVNRPAKLKQILRAQECVWQGEGVDLWSVISSNDPVARWFLPLTRLCKCFPTASHKFNELICLYSYHWFKYRKENDFSFRQCIICLGISGDYHKRSTLSKQYEYLKLFLHTKMSTILLNKVLLKWLRWKNVFIDGVMRA